MVSSSGMPVSLKTDLRFPITGQQGHGSRNIHQLENSSIISVKTRRKARKIIFLLLDIFVGLEKVLPN